MRPPERIPDIPESPFRCVLDVKAKLGVLKSQLPEGLKLELNWDTTTFIERSIHEILFTLVLAALLGTAAGLARALLGGPVWPAIPWLAACAALLIYVLRGWALSGAGARGLVDLFVLAPAYVAWKIVLSLRRSEHRHDEWVRTEREVPRGT